ncbi:STAS domain-containing protein [Actinoplanes sp. RD1]|uniref:STAS domain-containing protein n=1 Tax=Actinoplanes sp. RD1 TaxID=3064538 RepID=UPI0027410F22|nr:STAS domain-containing protein [Actinoplanes sp. RD1]
MIHAQAARGPVLSVSAQRTGAGATEVRVSGEIDMATVGLLTAELRRADAGHVVVDLGEVTFCDSAGLAALDEAYGAAGDQGRTLRVVNLQPQVSMVLRLTGILEALTRDPAAGQ